MKYIKWQSLLFIAVLLCLIALPVKAASSGSCGENLTWNLSDEGVLTISGSGDMQEYSSYSKVPWYGQRSSVKALELGDEVTSVSAYAFYYCTKLTSVTIPDSVADIGSNAFFGCTGLETLELGGGVVAIGDEAFSLCSKLTHLTIPDNVSVVGYYAFADCTALQTVRIGAGLSQIGDYAFCNCTALEKIQVIEGNQYYSSDSAGCLFDQAKTVLIQAPAKLSSGYVIPDGVEEILEEAFFDCTDLVALGVPGSLTTVGSYAFYSCSKLSHITYAGPEQEWDMISIYDENNYLIQAKTKHFDADGTFYYYENCVSSGMYCVLCKDFVAGEQTNSGSHSYTDYTDLECGNCGYVRAVSAIQISQKPDKLVFTKPDGVLDTAGGQLELTYTDGSGAQIDMTGDMVTGFDNTALGQQTLTVTYAGCKAYYSVSVVFGTPDSLTILTMPERLRYVTDSQISLTGLTLSAVYEGYGTYVVAGADAAVQLPDMTSSGKKTVTVSVGQAQVTFEILVHSKKTVTVPASLYPESSHNYGSNLDETKTFTHPGAENLILTFDNRSYVENKYDYIYLLDGQGNVIAAYTGKLYSEVVTVPGDTFSVRLVTDGSGTLYGYAFSSIVAEVAQHSFENGYCSVCGQLQYAAAVYEKGVPVAGGDTVQQALALCGQGQYLKLFADAQVELSLTNDLYIDLNGFDLSGVIRANGYAIYGMDSTTDSYTCDSIGYFTCTDEAGSPIVPKVHFKSDMTGTVKRYMAIKEKGYSFHRFYLGITHMTLKPTNDGVGFKAVFSGDEMVAAALDSFGYSMCLGNYTPRTVTKGAEGFVSGKTVTMRIDHFDVENYGQTNLYASVMLQLSDGTVIRSAECTFTLKGLVEQLNDNYTALTAAQLKAVADMIKKYAVIQSWKVENLYTE